MMFKSTEEQYGFGLHQPEQNDYDLYKRYIFLEVVHVSMRYNKYYFPLNKIILNNILVSVTWQLETMHVNLPHLHCHQTKQSRLQTCFQS